MNTVDFVVHCPMGRVVERVAQIRDAGLTLVEQVERMAQGFVPLPTDPEVLEFSAYEYAGASDPVAFVGGVVDTSGRYPALIVEEPDTSDPLE